MDIDGLTNKDWVLLPGTLCTGDVFKGLMDVLEVSPRHQTILRLDRPSVEDYMDVLDELPAQTVVCGFSLGAIVAAHAADRIAAQRLILFGVNPFADDPAKAPSRTELARDVMERGGADALKSRLPTVFGASPDTARTRICQMADDAADLIDAQTQLALSRPGALPALAKATMPVLSLTGSLDDAAPPDQGLAAAQAAPLGQFQTLDGLGHFALLEDPAACAAALAQMMQTQNEIG